MTFIEVMFSSALVCTVATAVVMTMSYSGHSFAALINYQELDGASRLALDTMSADIRQADGCSTSANLSATNLILVGTSVSSAQQYTLTYRYDSGVRTVTRRYADANGTNTTMLLTNCAAFALSYFQRNLRTGPTAITRWTMRHGLTFAS